MQFLRVGCRGTETKLIIPSPNTKQLQPLIILAPRYRLSYIWVLGIRVLGVFSIRGKGLYGLRAYPAGAYPDQLA